ncbi:MAG: GvpL/GvpF family gas vesicle protein [Gemmatimonadaceae bacterium]
MSATVEYVYCVIPATLRIEEFPAGIDSSAMRTVSAGEVAALTCSLDGPAYDSDIIAQKVGDPEWLAPRAVAHDAVVTWAADRGSVVPLPMWVMFADDSGVSRMLVDRESEFLDALARVKGAREFCVRIAADRAALAAAGERMDTNLSALEQQASLAAPGEAYLLGRKLAEARKSATRNAAVRIAEESHHALSRESRLDVARTTPASSEQGVILDGAYLVADENYDQFRTVLTELMRTFEPAGVHFDFTGPWPPYHFVRES